MVRPPSEVVALAEEVARVLGVAADCAVFDALDGSDDGFEDGFDDADDVSAACRGVAFAVLAVVGAPDPRTLGTPAKAPTRLSSVARRTGGSLASGVVGVGGGVAPLNPWSSKYPAQPVSSHVPMTTAMSVRPSRWAAVINVRLA